MMNKKVVVKRKSKFGIFFLIGIIGIMIVAVPVICRGGFLSQRKVVNGSHLIPYKSEHFIIHSDLDSRYVKFLQSNFESFYKEMVAEFFQIGWDAPLDIYYSKTQAGTQKIMNGLGDNDAVHYGVYIPDMRAIFTHRNMTSGGTSGLGTVYHEIIHHFVNINYKRPPTWFNEGLATFFGEETRCISGKLTLGCPNPWREQRLRQMIESGFEIDIKRITSLSASQFYRNRDNYHPTRALFYWMYENGSLPEYMKVVKSKGYGLDVLEETLGKSCVQINTELLTFVKGNCYPAAFYQDGRLSRNRKEKKAFFQESLRIKPDYYPAKVELALCFYEERDVQKCKDILYDVLKKTYSKEYSVANETIAKICYGQKDFSGALNYYKEAWKSSLHSEYRYYNSYMVAICYHELGDSQKAKIWLDVFLNENWEPQRDVNMLNFAKNYRVVKGLTETK